ncbi:transglycosylase domain-containing protein [Olsenella massiliensis]|uniref:transglycosylase domain-containing protein n=1 Tax=Olsenella massiliensis TaxID=1622075 RepID=UPI00071C359C|nr:transglycosylase domain-containing protein [Olsenella massiliensis]
MGIRTRRARTRSRTHIVGFGIAGIFGFVALLVLALCISLGALVSQWLQDLPDYSSADAYLVAEPTTVYAADGSVISEYYVQNRRTVEQDQMSDYVLKAIVDTEDKRFYQHNGVDPQGIVRAAVVQLGGGSEGASTITQQLVRNTVLSDEQFEQTLKRKVREAYIAVQMEKMYTKDQILTMYLNTIYFGHSAYGIEAAAVTYFDKDAKDLTLAEAATLCGLPQSPTTYDPLANPELATTRRNTVLDRMLTAGDITQEEHDAAVAEPLETNEGSFTDAQNEYPYFTDYIKQVLLQDFDQDTIMKGGLKVYTTLNPATQRSAEDAVSSQLSAIGNPKLQAALVAIDPNTGYVLAMVGGRDYHTSQYNMATDARRQVGSSFKTFTLIDAISQGMNPNIYLTCNSPMRFTSTWKVQNFANANYGNISLARAFAVSSNTGFVQVAQAVKSESIVSTAQSLGIREPMEAYDSLTLGTTGIPPIQMAEAYATVATNGVHRGAVAITKIEDRNGNVVYQHEDSPTQAISAPVAQASREVMEGVCKGGGTASQLTSLMKVNQPVAGKTGTSENYRDLWFCGITPQLSVAIWCGYEQEAAVYVGGSYGHPYNTTVPIFAKFLNGALEGVAREEFPTTKEAVTYKPNRDWTFSKTNASISGIATPTTLSWTNAILAPPKPKEEEEKEEGAEASQDTRTTKTNGAGTQTTTGTTPSTTGETGGGTTGAGA